MSDKPEGSKSVQNPARYRELSVPFACPDEANAAISAFMDELMALRVKHGIADVMVCISGNCEYAEGEGQFVLSAHYGDESRGEILAAYALGKFQAQRRDLVNRAVRGRTAQKGLDL